MHDRVGRFTYGILIVSFVFLISVFQSRCIAQSIDHTSDSLNNKNRSHYPWERFSVSAGGFVSANSSSIVLGIQQLGTGIQIDLEDALGLETSTFVTRFEAKYRLGQYRKHVFSIGYFDVYRYATKVLNEEIQVGDVTFPVGTEVSSKFDLTIIRAKYGYSFIQDERISMGASFGFYIMPITFSAKALNFKEQSTKFIAPLPLIGLYTDFKVKKNLYLKQSIEFLYLRIQNFSGRILDYNLLLEHKTFTHFGFGIGANLNGLNLSVTETGNYLDFVGKIGMQYSGIMLYANYYF